MIDVTLYSKENCPLCDDAEFILNLLKNDWKLHIEIVDIYKDDNLLEKYQLMIPVVMINGEEVDYGQISKEKVESFLRAIK